MTRRRTNVVPFERPAAYWAVKARKHDSPSQLPDAAKLMRKALEKSGDSGLALELSQIYARMHCYTASERYLMRACMREGLTGRICFLTGCAALNRNEEELGERALDLSLRLDPDGVYAEQAQEILETYPWRQIPYRPHCARGEELCRRVWDLLLRGRKKEAADTAKRAWDRAHTPEIALQLGALLPPRRGMIYLSYAARRLPGQARPWLLLARSCHLAGCESKAGEALERAAESCTAISDAEAYCQTAWDMGRHEEALALVNRQLEAMPASADYLRLKYESLRRMGDQAADRTLEMLLEIDPDQAAPLRRVPMETGIMDPERFVMLSVLGSLIYAAPERLKRGQMNRLLHRLTFTLDGSLDTQSIFRLAPPLWRKLTPAEKRACDQRGENGVFAAVAVCVLLMAGRAEEARETFACSRGKKRTLRFLRRFLPAPD